MMAKVPRSAHLRLETWLAYKTHDHSYELQWKLVSCWSEITFPNGIQVIERGLVTLDSLLAGTKIMCQILITNIDDSSIHKW